MGANHSQPKDHKEERKVKRSPTLPTLFGKTSSRLNLLNLGRRSPQPPATPVTPQAVMVVELTAGQGTASPEASVADPEDRPELTVDVRLFPSLSGCGLIALCCGRLHSRHKYVPCFLAFPHLLSSHPQSSGPRVRRCDRHAPTTRDGPLPGEFVESQLQPALSSVDLSRLTLLIRTRWR